MFFYNFNFIILLLLFVSKNVKCDSNITDLLAKPVRFIGVILTIVISALTLSGGLIILIRISKIKAGSKGTSLGFGIKLPFYFSSINCVLAIIQILNAVTNGFYVELCSISYFLATVLLGLHLFIGVTVVIMTNIDLNKKAYSTWGYKDYQLWLLILFIAIPSVAFAYAGLSYYGGIEWCIYPYRYDWMPITNIIIITIITIVLFTTMVYYIKLLNKLKNLKKPQADYVSISAIDESKQAFDRRNVRKILSYITVYLLQWATTLIYLITQLINFNNSNVYDWLRFILIAAIFIGSIGNIIQFLRIERWRYRSGYKTTINRQSSPLPTTIATTP